MMTERVNPFPSLLPQIDFTCYRPYYLTREISIESPLTYACGVDARKFSSLIHFDGG